MLDLTKDRIIITSFPGKTPEVRKARLQMHMEQLKILEDQFPNHGITTVCSGYTEKERKQFSKFNCYHITKPTLQHVKQDKIFRELGRCKLQSLLILDDDSVPDYENEFGIKPLEVIQRWLDYPEEMPASMVFFSGRGLLHDTYTNNRPPTVHTAPIRVAGPMFMVRSDFKIHLGDHHYSHHTNGGYVSLDTMVRMEMAASGYAVAKHRGIFFKGSCKAVGSSSTLTGIPAKRKEDKERTYDQIKFLWPWLFVSWKGDNKRPLPIWQLRGKKLNQLLSLGVLKQNKHGILYPNPEKAEAYFRMKKFIRPTLLGLIKKEK